MLTFPLLEAVPKGPDTIERLDMANKLVIGGVLVAAIFGGVLWLGRPAGQGVPVTSGMHSGADTAPAKPEDQIVVPAFSQTAQSGEIAFIDNCAACHGRNAAGTDQGPPLIHALYRPGHHSDAAIFAAAQNGVRAHHWRFGNMSPVAGITEAKLRWIVAYIREIQEANGIK